MGYANRLVSKATLLYAILLSSVLTAAWSALCLYQANVYQEALRSPALSQQNRPEYLFLNAWKLGKQSATQPKSLQLYAQIAAIAPPELKKRAYYNSANLYLKQATALLDQQGFAAWDDATPLLALAKDGYRHALRIQPNWLEAKYNLELALRLAPDIKSSTQKLREEDKNPEAEPQKGWPSIPGFPRGMP